MQFSSSEWCDSIYRTESELEVSFCWSSICGSISIYICSSYLFRYDKDETVKMDDDKIYRYTHLLVEQKRKYFYENEHLKHSHDTLESINCFSSIGIEYRSFCPVKIKTKPCIVLLRRKSGFEPPLVVKDIDGIAETDMNAANETSDMEYGHDDDDPATNSNVDDAIEWDVVDANKTIVAMNELRKPTKHTKLKIKRFIETHFRAEHSTSDPNNEQAESVVPVHKRSAKSNIRDIIKSERIKEIAEKISQMDLKSMCDLEKDSVKSCLIKIIDEHEDK